jgi:hypothetical protein
MAVHRVLRAAAVLSRADVCWLFGCNRSSRLLAAFHGGDDVFRPPIFRPGPADCERRSFSSDTCSAALQLCGAFETAHRGAGGGWFR